MLERSVKLCVETKTSVEFMCKFKICFERLCHEISTKYLFTLLKQPQLNNSCMGLNNLQLEFGKSRETVPLGDLFGWIPPPVVLLDAPLVVHVEEFADQLERKVLYNI